MQQHPVPQNIIGFRFKLIGFLTLKQFAFLAGASVVSFVFYLIFSGFFAVLFITPVVLAGLALAFANINGMEFDQWAVAFFNAMTKPTQRVWRKEAKTFSFLSPEFSYYLKRPASNLPAKSDRTKLDAFLSQMDTRPDPNRKLDTAENTKLSALNFGVEENQTSNHNRPPHKADVRPLQHVLKEQLEHG